MTSPQSAEDFLSPANPIDIQTDRLFSGSESAADKFLGSAGTYLGETADDRGFWEKLLAPMQAYGEGFNLGLFVQFFGMPGDLFEGALFSFAEQVNKLNLPHPIRIPEPEETLVGSEAFKKAVNLIGIQTTPSTGTRAERIAGRAGEEMGFTTGAVAVPGTLALRPVPKALSTIKKPSSTIGRAFTDPFRTAPALTATIETIGATGAGTGAGFGREIVRELPEESQTVTILGEDVQTAVVADVVGQFAGGLGVTLGPVIAVKTAVGALKLGGRGLEKIVPEALSEETKAVTRIFRDTYAQIQPKNVDLRAREVLKEGVANPEIALQKLKDPNVPELPGLEFTSAQITQDPGLQQLELSQAAQLPGVFAVKRAQQNQAIHAAINRVKKTLGKATTPGETTTFFETKIAKTQSFISQTINTAKENAVTKLEELAARVGAEPGLLKAELSTIVTEEFDTALKLAREQESSVWNKINRGQKIDTSLIIKEAEDQVASTTKVRKRATKKDIPEIIDEVILAKDPTDDLDVFTSVFTEAETLDEILDLRTILLDQIRLEKSGPKVNANKVRLLNKLHDSVMKTLNDSDRFFENIDFIPGITETESKRLFNEARAFSNELNTVFRKGTVGKVLRLDTGGGLAVPAIETLSKFVRSGVKGLGAQTELFGARDFIKKIGGSGNLIPATKNYIYADFFGTAVNANGEFSLTVAKRWLKQRDDMLSFHPEIKKNLQTLITAQEKSTFAIKIGKRAKKQVEKSRASFWLKGDPETSMKRALGQADKTKGVRSLVNTAKQDPTGDALRGLRHSMWDLMETKSLSIQNDLFDTPFINPKGMSDFIKTNRNVFSELGFSEAQIKNLETATEAAQVMGRTTAPIAISVGGAATAEKLLTMPALLSRFYALERGVIGGRFLASELLARLRLKVIDTMTKGQLVEILNDALVDTDLMQTLLSPVTEITRPKINKTLNLWMIKTGADVLKEDTDFPGKGR